MPKHFLDPWGPCIVPVKWNEQLWRCFDDPNEPTSFRSHESDKNHCATTKEHFRMAVSIAIAEASRSGKGEDLQVSVREVGVHSWALFSSPRV